MTPAALEASAIGRSRPAADGLEDVCLIYPNTNTQGRLGTHAFDLVLPPLGLAYLAAVLERAGYSVRIVDAFAEGLGFEETLARVRGRFRVVGLYCHTQNFPAIVEMARRLKAEEPAPRVIIGGPHPTALPVESLSDGDAIDALAFGEGEGTIVELVETLLEEGDLGKVRGIYYRREGGIATTGPRPQISDIDSLPLPAWHLLPMHLYRSFIEAEGHRVVHIIGSRGCFNDCNYCHSTKMWGPQVRWHSAERVLEEIDQLRGRYGIEFIQFFDDVFTMEPRRVKRLMPEFKKRGLADRWICSTRIDLLNEDTVRQLKHGGVHHVAIGIETVNDRLLKVINKNVTKEQTLATIDLCRRYGVRVMGMFILGLPTETRDEALETIRWVRKTDFHLAIFSFLTVYPGTNFWQQLKGSPHLQRDFSKYNLSQNFTYLEPGRSQDELQALMREAYLGFYLRPRTIAMLAWMMLKQPRQLWTALKGFAAVFANLLFSRRYEPPPVTHA